jgi:hypothetical protein
VAIQDDQIRIGFMLKARTEISTAAVASSTVVPSLPALERVAEAPGKLAIALPLRADYEVVRLSWYAS